MVSSATVMFTGAACTMQHQPSCYFVDTYVKFNRAAKPEVVITLDLYKIEMWFQVLLSCFQGSPSKYNINRHVISSISMRNSIWRPVNSIWRPQNRRHIEFLIDFDEITGKSMLHGDGDT